MTAASGGSARLPPSPPGTALAHTHNKTAGSGGSARLPAETAVQHSRHRRLFDESFYACTNFDPICLNLSVLRSAGNSAFFGSEKKILRSF
jgi:hypothetical protein